MNKVGLQRTVRDLAEDALCLRWTKNMAETRHLIGLSLAEALRARFRAHQQALVGNPSLRNRKKAEKPSARNFTESNALVLGLEQGWLPWAGVLEYEDEAA
jgi:hypothetical protein